MLDALGSTLSKHHPAFIIYDLRKKAMVQMFYDKSLGEYVGGQYPCAINGAFPQKLVQHLRLLNEAAKKWWDEHNVDATTVARMGRLDRPHEVLDEKELPQG